MRKKRDDEIEKLLSAISDSERPIRARVIDCLTLIRRRDLGRPTRETISRHLRVLKDVAIAERNEAVLELIDQAFERMRFYKNKREELLETKRIFKEKVQEIQTEGPGRPPGPAYAGYEWFWKIVPDDTQIARVKWALEEIER